MLRKDRRLPLSGLDGRVEDQGQRLYPRPAPRLAAFATEGLRWLLMDGYVYDIRDDQDHPPCGKAAGR